MEKGYFNKFPLRFKCLRLSRELNVKRLAEILNVSPSTIYKWEKGQKIPDAYELICICLYFEVSCDYLLGLSNFSRSFSPERIEHLRKIIFSKKGIDT